MTSPRVLVLGGSWFLGRAAVAEALARGCAVTTFRRGLSGEDVAGAEIVRGDRTVQADLDRLTTSGPWDVVVDTAGYVPRESGMVARALEPVAGRFVFVSTVSAYAGWPVEPLTEASEVLECPPDAGPDYGYDGDPGRRCTGSPKPDVSARYWYVFGPERTTVLRPGVILWPWEYVGRLPWWLRRVQRGGRVLAPVSRRGRSSRSTCATSPGSRCPGRRRCSTWPGRAMVSSGLTTVTNGTEIGPDGRTPAWVTPQRPAVAPAWPPDVAW